MSKEKWAPVPGFEKSYEVSSKGRVRTIARDVLNPQGEIITSIPSKEVTIRKTSQNPIPYVVLHDGKRYHQKELKSLMIEVFGAR